MTSPSPLLTRIRRRRGTWIVMLMAMLINMLASSACLADTSSPWEEYTSSGISTADGCALGEASCHCACAHSVALPSMALTVALSTHTCETMPELASMFVAQPPTSVLRPPIA